MAVCDRLEAQLGTTRSEGRRLLMDRSPFWGMGWLPGGCV